ncbi:MICOS complex subunit Mic60 isoform X4 [Apis mellifera]|uniref:MICOS complex subunit MIC60 n=1 Tax=Apis mellifera TaxID=7460 RepID=A0A7M7GRD9_APIME|nr:MICOS complex subunit Mic60 isoform X4 [Apis mellifera]|eukprot:XP_006560041.1 MICOS complex subunit Mic60 isoform X4 [Apis mellifera]
MFRIGLKFPCNGLNRVKKNGSSRLYLTTRYYETRARTKYDQECRFSKDVKLISRIPVHKYSTDTPKREKSRGTTKTLLTLTAVAIGASGVLLYAKHDPKFRANLEGWIPGTDKTIQIIFQEESSYFEFIRTFFETLKQTIISSLFGGESKQTAPKPTFVPLIDKKEPPINEPYAEIRISKEKGEEIEIVAEKPAPPPKDVPEELMPANLVELETSCGEAASKAIAAYQKAICVIQDYNKDVMRVVESLHATVGSAIWNRLKESTDKKKEAVKEAEDLANEAMESLNKIYNLIKDPKFDAPSHMKTAARRNIKKIMDDVDEAKKKYQTEIECGNMAERYWKQVKMARENLNEELQILFPNINIHEKKITLDENTFDLFVLHMYNKVSNLQRELEKTRTINESRIRAALKATGETMTEERLHTLVCLELDKEKQIYESEFSQKLLEEQKKFDDELRRQLKLQEQVHADHLQETITLKEEEAERNLQRALNEQSEQDSIKHKEQLAVVIGRLRGVEAAFKARMEEEKDATNAQILWSACTALARAIKSGPPGAPIEKIVRPLESEIKAVCKAAPKEDPLVMAAIKGIPVEAAKRGVFPEDILRERFLKVEQVARRLAMVPEEGAALPVYLLSYLQSYLMFKDVCPISRSELEDKPFDVEDLNTFDILNRARYWLDRGDFKMTLRYMNLLKGAPRSVAKDWMNETRILLETQQVVETLLAYAGAMGLMFLGAGDSKCSSKQRLQQTVDRRSWRRRRRKLVRKRRRIAERARRLRKRGARWTYKSIRSAVDRVLGWIVWKDGRSGKGRNGEQVRFEVFLRSITNTSEDKGKMILLVQRDDKS